MLQATANVDLALNIISIQNHNFQTGQTVILDTQGGSKIGIATTSHTTGTKDIIMAARSSGIGGSAMFENGYNVQIPGPVTGTAVTANPPGMINLESMDLEILMVDYLASPPEVQVLDSKSSLTLIKLLDSVYLQQLL